MTRLLWAALGLALGIAGLAWVRHLLKNLRRDLSVDDPRVSTRWLEERLRNRR